MTCKNSSIPVSMPTNSIGKAIYFGRQNASVNGTDGNLAWPGREVHVPLTWRSKLSLT